MGQTETADGNDTVQANPGPAGVLAILQQPAGELVPGPGNGPVGGSDTNAFNTTNHCRSGMNMEMATTTMSRNGQVVIPLSLRKAMGLGNKDRFLVVGDKDTIVLRRLTKDRMRQEFEALLTYFSEATAKAGLTPEDAEKEIQAYRAEKRREHENRR